MPVHAYSPTDWFFFLAPYLVWCCVGLFVWRKVSRRLQRISLRALVFALIFAPTIHPVVREAGIIAPASLSLLLIALVEAMPVNWHSSHSKAQEFIAYFIALPLICSWILAWLYMVLRPARARSP